MKCGMPLETSPPSPSQEVHWGSDIASVRFDGRGLKVIVARVPLEEGQFQGLEVFFRSASGFRFLDELDLARYWISPGFLSGHHVLSVNTGGWGSEENELQGFESSRTEWLVVTGNGCLSVFAQEPPTIREGEFEDEAFQVIRREDPKVSSVTTPM